MFLYEKNQKLNLNLDNVGNQVNNDVVIQQIDSNTPLPVKLTQVVLDGTTILGDASWNRTNAVNNDFSLNSEYFEYFGNWRNLSGTDTHAEAFITGDTASFRFNGTGLRIYAELNVQNIEGVWKTYNNNNVMISIDGGDFVQMNMLRDYHIVGDELIYEALDLAKGTHTAIIKLGEHDPSIAFGNSFYLAGVSVCNGNVLKVGTWTDCNTIYMGEKNTTYFDFDGDWRIMPFSPDVVEAYIPGSSATVKFNGTGLRLRFSLNVQMKDGKLVSFHGDKITVTIDDETPVEVSLWRNEPIVADNQIVYDIRTLSEGEHTAVITLKEATELAISQSIYFAGISVLDGTAVPIV